MQYKRLGNIVAVVLASALGWTLTPGIKPIQADQPDSPAALQSDLGAVPANRLENTPASIPASRASNLSTSELSNSKPSSSGLANLAPTATKIGEPASAQAKLQSPDQAESQNAQPLSAIAKVFPHDLKSRPAATVYVRGIPVLTFLGEPGSGTGATTAAVKSASATSTTAASDSTGEARKLATQEDDENSPLWKATRLAAKLNQLQQSGDLDSRKISVKWDKDTYLVQMDETTLVTLTSDIVLPDSTGARTEDALQATNRLRRLLGNEAAEPLTQVADLPAPPKPKVVAAARTEGSFYQQGWASWYGPGFNGNQTANGEIFNQNAMTAAHLHLSFGTLVRVTNMDNGSSVTVRINDRGPYAGDRVIDLSAAAADYIGLTHAGVAPVRIEVLK